MAIISARLWRDRFARSPEALGRVITLDGVSYTIVGVVPSWFSFQGDADVYTPLGQKDPLILDDRGLHPLLCIARLKPGMTITQAQADIRVVQSNLNQIHPDTNRGLGTVIVPLKEGIVEGADDVLLLLLGAMGLVLLIACANVANLLLARSAARTREFGIRLALGASRVRIVRQLITESVLLSFAGGGFGLALAHWGVRPILTAASVSLPRSENIAVNTTVLLFTVCVSISVGVLFGLAPALKSSKTDLEASLKGGGRGSTKGPHRTEDILVIVQVALTTVLLVGAGLFFRTVRQLWHVNPGFDARNILTFKVGLSPSVTKTPSSTRIAYQQLIERVRQIPGVQVVDFTTLVPLSRLSNTGAFWLGSQEPTSIAEAPRAVFQQVGPDYLRVMRLPLLQGRFFSSGDTTESANVVVIDSVLAQTYFPEGNPVGETITINLWGPARIVGVVGHVKHWGLGNTDDLPQNQIYMSFNQLPDPWVPMFNRNLTALVRTPLEASAVLPAIKAAVYGAKGDQPVHSVRKMEQFVTESMVAQRSLMILLGTFASLALLLASVGIYGVISYLVTQRVREIGIRMALGAKKRDVLQSVLVQGLRLAISGIAIGVVAASMATRLLSSVSALLYGVGPTDPMTFSAVSLVLIGVALLACYVPARRAARLDPLVALRHE